MHWIRNLHILERDPDGIKQVLMVNVIILHQN